MCLNLRDSTSSGAVTHIKTSGAASNLQVAITQSNIHRGTTAIDYGFGNVQLDGSHFNTLNTDLINNGGGNIVSKGLNIECNERTRRGRHTSSPPSFRSTSSVVQGEGTGAGRRHAASAPHPARCRDPRPAGYGSITQATIPLHRAWSTRRLFIFAATAGTGGVDRHEEDAMHRQSRSKYSIAVVAALGLMVLLVAAAPAWGAPLQRTFVASYGLDPSIPGDYSTRPCNLPFPCRTFNAAIGDTIRRRGRDPRHCRLRPDDDRQVDQDHRTHRRLRRDQRARRGGGITTRAS